MLITIVVPFHNEAESLPVLLPEIADAISAQSSKKFEVLLVNDCSTDGGLEFATRYSLQDPRFRVLQMPQRGGQTGAFELAFAEAQGEYVIRMDADLQDDPRDLPKLLAKVDAGYDLVLGKRTKRKHSFAMRLMTKAYDIVTSTIFQTKLHSNSGSFIAFRTIFLKNIPFQKNDHRYLPLIVMRRGGTRRITVHVVHRERQFGQSKYKVMGKVLFGFIEIFRFYIRYSKGFYDMEGARSSFRIASESMPKEIQINR